MKFASYITTKTIIMRVAIVMAILTHWIMPSLSQVTKVKFQIRYNSALSVDTLGKYECYIVITQGSATSTTNRVQGGSQYSVVVPTGSIVSLPTTNFNMPLQNNQTYTGTVPTQWSLANQVFNAGQTQSDFYGITNSTSPASFFNNLVTGDTIKLFTLDVKLPPNACKSSVRLFENGVDPNSSAVGMGGGDFSNGYVLGFTSGNTQDYDGNITSVYPSERVKNANDSGLWSLRRAVQCAGPESTIIFEDIMINDTIVLMSKIDILKNVKFTQPSNKVVKIKSSFNAPSIEVKVNKVLDLTNVAIFAKNNAALQGRAIQNYGKLNLTDVKIYDPLIGTSNSGSTIKNFGTITLNGNTFIKKP